MNDQNPGFSRAILLFSIPGLLFCACQFAPADGLRQTPAGNGPVVVFDLDAKPLPEIPFPNDLATRPDPRSPTGRRINASQIAPTRLERTVRQKIDQLDGFGTLQPISVTFDAPLDIDNLLARHRDNLDFSDDAVYLIDIDPESPAYGQPVLLDVGRGNYPLTLKRSDSYFPSDPRSGSNNLLFETVEEDLNGNGLLDPGEDTDDDGVLDHPNVWPPGAPANDGLMTFYEQETNTLLLRPVVPLREQTTYAVVLTDRLIGRDGQPVRSPFAWVHHLDQRDALTALTDVIARDPGLGLSIEQLAFAWTFTTQTVTGLLVAIREGFYGIGPLDWLAAEYPVTTTPDLVRDAALPDEEAHSQYMVPTALLMEVFELVGPSLLGDNMDMAGPILDSFENVDYFVSGTFESPDFLRTGLDGLDGRNLERENMDVDLSSGRASHQRNRIRFTMAIPKATPEHQPPFDVVVYCHSYSSMRAEALGFAGYMAKHGKATVGIEAWGHGMPVDDLLAELVITAGAAFGFEPFAAGLLEGRGRDLNGDGAWDSGGDYWTAYAFHTRDVVRQSVADHFQLVRVLRSWDGVQRWALDQDGDGQGDLAGDFNGDGQVDAGGQVKYYAWGQSGGGIHSAVLAPLEPAIIAAAPTAGGGGMSDVGLRTMLSAVRRAVMLRTMGPLIVGEPAGDGQTRVTLLVPLGAEEVRLEIGQVAGLSAGDQVVVTNLDQGEDHLAHVRPGPRFRVSMEADATDRFEIAFSDPNGTLIQTLSTWAQDVHYTSLEEPTYLAGAQLATPTEGYGMQRGTPDLRRMVALFQVILEPADPANYAPHYFLDPLDIQPEGPTVTNLLEVTCLGDQDVPIQTQATIGRAAGIIPHLQVDPRYGLTPNDWLIQNHVYEGLAHIGRFPDNDVVFDPDNLDEGQDGFDAPGPAAADALRMTIPTATGVSGVRFAYMQPGGQHGIFPTGNNPQFDMFNYFVNLVARFFATDGQEILDDPCLATSSCPDPPRPGQ